MLTDARSCDRRGDRSHLTLARAHLRVGDEDTRQELLLHAAANCESTPDVLVPGMPGGLPCCTCRLASPQYSRRRETDRRPCRRCGTSSDVCASQCPARSSPTAHLGVAAGKKQRAPTTVRTTSDSRPASVHCCIPEPPSVKQSSTRSIGREQDAVDIGSGRRKLHRCERGDRCSAGSYPADVPTVPRKHSQQSTCTRARNLFHRSP